MNNLSAKLMLTLFPPNTPFFRMSIGQFDLLRMVNDAIALLAEEQNLDVEQAETIRDEQFRKINEDFERRLAAVETAIMREFELLNNRSTDSEALKHLIVAGNVLRYSPVEAEKNPRIYSMANYVTKRDPDGRVLEIITREGVSPQSLSPEIREACGIKSDDETNAERDYDLFTHIRRAHDDSGEHWAVVQELNGYPVPESEGEYPIDNCPWLALRWTKVDGEDYGRGHVEEYLGALVSLEGLSESLLMGAAAASRTLVMVNTTSANGTKLKDVARAKNGAVIPGSANDVTFLHSDKYHDLRTPAEQIQKLTQELGYAFLITSSVQRDAERVTAQEVRLMAQELETALGGVYTTLASEYQMALVTNLTISMQARGALPELPSDVKPVILTGMQALGRNTDFNRLMQLAEALRMLPMQEEVGIRISTPGWISQISAAIGVNIEGLFISEEEVAQIKQQQQQMQQQAMMIERLGPQAIQAGAKMMEQQGAQNSG